uniref:PH domain-containing protein n=1 Tax=Peronospora matthiolae TaxID=2874970 RepID=A0AAV1T2D1_9STRA
MSRSSVYGEGCAGWVYKQGSLVKNWKKRFMVLRERQLTYYDTDIVTPTVKAKGSFQVITVELSPEIQNGLLVHGCGGRVLKLYTLSAEATGAWYNLILDATMLAPQQFTPIPFDRFSTSSAFLSAAEKRLSIDVERNQREDEAAELLHRLEPAPLSINVGTKQVTHMGWLKKEGARVKSWKRRYFVLRGSVLSYFDSEDTGAAAKGYGHVRAVEIDGKVKRGLDIMFDTGRLLRVSARTSTEMQVWLSRLSDAIEATNMEQSHLRQSLAAHAPLRLSFVGVPVLARMTQECQQHDKRHWNAGIPERHSQAFVPSKPMGVTAKVPRTPQRLTVNKTHSSSSSDGSYIPSGLSSQMSSSSSHDYSNFSASGASSVEKPMVHTDDASVLHSSSSSTSFDSDVDYDSDDSEGDWI